MEYVNRFTRWRLKLSSITRFLVDEVCLRVVPLFESHGFEWLKTNDPPAYRNLNYLTFLRRQDEDWAVVVIKFAGWGRPWLMFEMSVLPPVCRQLKNDEIVLIPRQEAYLTNGPVVVRLAKGRFPSADLFGMVINDCLTRRPWALIRYALDRKAYIKYEVDQAVSLLPLVFKLFDEGIPAKWYAGEWGHLDDHFVLVDSWQLAERSSSHDQT